MSAKITAYDLLISCPSDVSQYVGVIEEQVRRFNDSYGRAHNVIIRTSNWKRNCYCKFGCRPQEAINEQIVNPSDFVIGIFWTRFGTPTENFGSGTEEEIERMIAGKKQVFLYFLDKPVSPSQINQEQYSEVQKFKKKRSNDGIYFDVQDENELASRFRENIELYFTSNIKGGNYKKKNGRRKILWVDDRPENNVYARSLLEKYGLVFDLALSTDRAMELIEHNDFALIISDMARKEGMREGYILLEEVRKIDAKIPFLIYCSGTRPEHVEETVRRGGQGHTSSLRELIDMVFMNLHT